MAFSFYQTIFTDIDTALSTHVVTASGNLIGYLNPIFTSMFIIWITVWGYMAIMGRLEGILQDSFLRIIRIAFIITLGLKSAQYNSIIVPFLQDSPEWLASVIIGSPTSDIGITLDTLLEKILSLGNTAWAKGGVTDIGNYLIALMIYGFGGILTILLASMLMMSKVVLTLLLAIGPLFIIASLFQTTQRFFDSWIGVLMNAAIMLILASSLGSLLLNIASVYASSIVNPTISRTIGLALLFSMLIFIVKQLPGIAAALGGGFALSAQGAIRSLTDKIRGTGRAINNTPRNYRLAQRRLQRNDTLTAKGVNVATGATARVYSTFRGGNSVSGR